MKNKKYDELAAKMKAHLDAHTPEEIRAELEECGMVFTDNPVSTIEEELDNAREDIKLLRGALLDFLQIKDNEPEFWAMEFGVNSVSCPENDRKIVLNAISALRKTR